MRFVQIKPISKMGFFSLFLVKELRLLTATGPEAGIQLTHHPTELHHKELIGAGTTALSFIHLSNPNLCIISIISPSTHLLSICKDQQLRCLFTIRFEFL